MVCAEFGHPALAPHVKGISVLNAVLALLCAVFGIMGCVSYSNSEKAISTAPYTAMVLKNKSDKSTAAYYFGLRAYVIFSKVGDADGEYGEINTFKDCLAEQDTYCEANPTQCQPESTNYCKKCNKAGTAVVSMCSLALIAAFVAFLAHLLRATCDSTFSKDISFLGGITAFVFGVIAFSVYRPCHSSIKLASDIFVQMGAEINFGTGAKLVAASFGMILIISLFSLSIPVAVAGTQAQAVPTSEATTKV